MLEVAKCWLTDRANSYAPLSGEGLYV